MASFDAIVIGGGFYGATIAAYLVQHRQMRNVLLLEREDALLKRASLNNQARVHNGYHYPRSFITAYRSRINLPRFIADWPSVVFTDFTKLYAIARQNSKVTGAQFARFCKDIGADIQPAQAQHAALFEPRLVENVFEVQEYAFDARKLARLAQDELNACQVQQRYGVRAQAVCAQPDGLLGLNIVGPGDATQSVSSRFIFNCTYSGLNQLHGDFGGTQTKLKHEITEMALMEMPEPLKHIGVTVMDGPFFSFMPFPSEGLHTVSHVRYTPHFNWADEPGTDPYAKLAAYHRESRVGRMVRDIARYVPAIQGARYERSLFEVKTVLTKNEGDDGRPILFEQHAAMPGLFTILGGKIDNIYDVLERLDTQPLELHNSLAA